MTSTTTYVSPYGAMALAIVSFAFLLPMMTSADSRVSFDSQAQLEMHDAIKSQVLHDSRTNNLTPPQLETMVNLLTQQALKQGLTASQVVWRPGFVPATSTPPQNICDRGVMCAFDDAGISTTIVLGIGGITLALIVILLVYMLRRLFRGSTYKV